MGVGIIFNKMFFFCLVNGFLYSVSFRFNMMDFIIFIIIDLDNIDFIYVFEYCGFYLCFFWMLDEISKCIWKISIVLVVSINF